MNSFPIFWQTRLKNTSPFCLLALFGSPTPVSLLIFDHGLSVQAQPSENALILFLNSLPSPQSFLGSTSSGAKWSMRLVSISSAWSPGFSKTSFLSTIWNQLVTQMNIFGKSSPSSLTMDFQLLPP